MSKVIALANQKGGVGKKAVQKIKEHRNSRLDTSPTDTADGYTSEQTSHS